MKKFYCLIFCLFFIKTASAQSHLMPKFMRRILFEKDSSKRSSVIPLPVLSSAPETGIEIGGSVLYSFYTDTVNRDTRVSNVFAYGTITTKGQNRASVSTSYWTSKNIYHYSASLGFLNFPSNFYGIGNATRSADAELIGEKRYKFNLAGEKLISKNIYVGLVASVADYRYNSTGANGIFETDPLMQDRSGGAIASAGPSFIFDTRNNNTYTTRGMFLTTNFSYIKGLFGNNGYNGTILSAEFSEYFLLAKRWVLAYDLYDNSLFGGQTPFYLLPEMGSDELMRGYYNGRYRDKNYVAGQTELRYRLSDRFGLVGFTGTGTVFHNSFNTDMLKPNYGGGVRYFFDVEKGLSIRLDYGVGEQPAGETRQSGFYIGLGEAF